LLGIWENGHNHVLAHAMSDFQSLERPSSPEMPAR
jgi:hypothetical protein